MANNTGFKYGGRQAGTPNKVTIEMRKILSDFVAFNINKMQKSFDQLKPKDKLIFMERLFKYVLPPLTNLEPDRNEDDDLKLEKLRSDWLEAIKIGFHNSKQNDT